MWTIPYVKRILENVKKVDTDGKDDGKGDDGKVGDGNMKKIETTQLAKCSR